jgi:hypothetical protein
MHQFNSAIAGAVTAAMKRLLSEKHLYQSVELDLTFIPALAQKLFQTPQMSVVSPAQTVATTRKTVESIAKSGRNIADYPWVPFIRFGEGKPAEQDEYAEL